MANFVMPECDSLHIGSMSFRRDISDFVFCRDEVVGWEELSEIITASGGGGSGGGGSTDGSPIEYAGLTSTTYNGELGGFSGANEKCSSEFPGSRLMWGTDLRYAASEITDFTTWGIFFCDAVSINPSSRPYCGINGFTANSGIINCSGLSSGFSGYSDGLMTYRDAQFGMTACSINNSLHCVRDRIVQVSAGGGSGGAPAVTTPDAFDFVDATGAPNAWINSNIVQITGITISVPISISGDNAQYRLCSTENCSNVVQDFGSASGSISPNRFLQLRQRASATRGSTQTLGLSLGPLEKEWNLLTPEELNFGNLTGQSPATTVVSSIVQVNNITDGTSISLSTEWVGPYKVGTPPINPSPQQASNREYRICSDAACSTVVRDWSETASTIDPGQFVQLRGGTSSGYGRENITLINVAGGAISAWSKITSCSPSTGEACQAFHEISNDFVRCYEAEQFGTQCSQMGGNNGTSFTTPNSMCSTPPAYAVCRFRIHEWRDGTVSCAGGCVEN